MVHLQRPKQNPGQSSKENEEPKENGEDAKPNNEVKPCKDEPPPEGPRFTAFLSIRNKTWSLNSGGRSNTMFYAYRMTQIHQFCTRKDQEKKFRVSFHF